MCYETSMGGGGVDEIVMGGVPREEIVSGHELYSK